MNTSEPQQNAAAVIFCLPCERNMCEWHVRAPIQSDGFRLPCACPGSHTAAVIAWGKSSGRKSRRGR